MPNYNSVAYPLGGPVVAGSTITVDQYIQNPTRVTRYLSDLNLRGYISPLIFGTPSGVSGGAVVYDQLTLNDLFSTRDVQNVEPGAEFPIVTSDNSQPLVAPVEKFGGKFFVTDEAKDRNDTGVIRNEGRKLMNVMMRKMDQKAIAVLDASISGLGSQTVAGHSWSTVVTGGSSQTNATGFPQADLAAVQMLADVQELGVTFNTWLVNPAQKMSFDLVYGPNADAARAAYGIRMIASNRVAAGTAYVVEAGNVGEIRSEKPLSTETWREGNTQRTWFQTDLRVALYVTNPYSVVKVTGLA